MRGLLSIVVVAAALTFVGASRAARGQSSYQPATLTIVTVPRLAGVHLAFDGRIYVTGRQGQVRIETTRGRHLLQILDTRLNAPGVRSTFSRWEDNRYTAGRTITIRRNTVLDAGFQQSVRVSFAFADLAGRPVVGRVSRMTLSNTLGSRVSFAPSWPQWLRATGLARSFRGLEPTFVQYSIERALVNGSNVVNQSQQRFYPAKKRRFTTHLLLYSARVRVRDFLFGTSIGSQLNLVYPNGNRVAYPLRGGKLLLSSLPRGEYALHVRAGGYVPSVSLALSKNQSLDVKVVSYLDMSLLLGLVLLSVTVLILIPRPFLRLRLSELGSGRRPTPDDLEPPTPLSRARKKLIARYMPEPDTGGSSASRPVPRLPLPTPRPLAAPTSGESVERPLRKLASRSVETAVESVRRRGQRLSDVPPGLPLHLRPAARGRAAALSGERIDLINVYMREQATSAPEKEPPATRQPQQPEGVPNAAAAARRNVPSTNTAPESPAPAAPPRLAPVIELRPAAEEKTAPAVTEAAAPANEEKPAPARKRTTAPARRKRARPAVKEKLAAEADETPTPAVEGDAAPPRKRAPRTGRKRAAATATGEDGARTAKRKSAPPTKETRAPAAKAKTSPQPVRKRAPAKKNSTNAVKSISAARQKSQVAAKQKPKPGKAKKTATPAAAEIRKRRTSVPATPGKEAARDHDAATNGGASSGELRRHLPDLVADVEALRGELKKVRTTAEKGRRKGTRTAPR